MIRRSLCTFALLLVVSLGTATSASAVTIDFEATPTGTYSLLSYGDVDISFLAGTGLFEVQNQTPDPPPTGHVLISFFTNPGSGSFQALFGGGGASFVSIDVSDYSPSDDDETHLRAYDASGNLLDSDFLLIPTGGPGGTLIVSSLIAIARVEWNETGSFAGAVYWDNLTYRAAAAPIPEPATLSLMALGLGGYVARRRRTAKSRT